MNIETNNPEFVDFDYDVAIYKPQKIKDYEGNPFIEALPPILETEAEVINAICSLPKVEQEERRLSPLLKLHIIRRVKHFVLPLPIHVRLEPVISTLIRQSYRSRNPFEITYKRKIKILNQMKAENELTPKIIEEQFKNLGSTADCIFINGVSGMGKTTFSKKVLNQYPQVIRHTEYNGQPFTKTQIVWIKVDCPYDGSFVTLCRNIFQEIDRLLGTRWNEKYGYLTRSASTMVMYLTKLLVNYNVGVLVIDEIQSLNNTKGNPSEMLDFFVTLTNMISVPIVFIGTNSARDLFQTNFRLARRIQSEGYFEFDRLKKDSKEWELFYKLLWDFNVLGEDTILNDEFNEAFFDQCQGILAVAIMLFMFAQSRAIVKGKTKLSPEIIKETANEDLAMINKMIIAIRSGDPVQMNKFDDISVDENAILRSYQRELEMSEQINEIIKQKTEAIKTERNNINEKLFFEISISGFFNEIKEEALWRIINKIVAGSDISTSYEDLRDIIIGVLQDEKTKIKKTKTTSILSTKSSLLSIYEKAKKDKQHPYDAFKKHGFIGDPNTEFIKAE